MSGVILHSWKSALQEGWDLAVTHWFTALSAASYRYITVVGMGGSAIAGHLLNLLMRHYVDAEVQVVDGPLVSRCGDGARLYIVCSYSGMTWEALSAFESLLQQGVPLLVVTSGGTLAARAYAEKVPVLLLSGGLVPRAALPWFLGALLAVTEKLALFDAAGVCEQLRIHWDRCAARIMSSMIAEPFVHHVKEAQTCHVWGVKGDTDAAAYRLQTQLNENAKMAAVTSYFPELCHNLIVGFTPCDGHAPIILLETDHGVPSIKRGIKSLVELLLEHGIALYKPVLFGDTWVEQVAYSLWWSDSVSYHLGRMRGHSIAATVLIDQLKQIYAKKVVSHEERTSS